MTIMLFNYPKHKIKIREDSTIHTKAAYGMRQGKKNNI